MKKILLIPIFLCLWQISQAQTPFKEAQKFTFGFQLAAGYHQSSFLNEHFTSLMEEEEISRDLGAVVNGRLTASPFIFDLNWFSSNFRVDENNTIFRGYDNTFNLVRHRGFGGGVSLILTPTSKYVYPYVGFEYQASSLALNKPIWSNTDPDPNALISATKMSDTVWKAGITFRLGSKIVLTGEYKQSFDAASETAFNQLQLTFGANLWKGN